MTRLACGKKGCGAACPIKKGGENVRESNFVVALAGNPNTGKSTVFNALTGLRQHTGNWPGKTVVRMEGSYVYGGGKYKIVDLPGTYSLLSDSEDEEVARDFILFGKPDVTVVVVDASRLERNLSLVFQILQITNKVVLCLNLMDEADRHNIKIDHRALSRELRIPVVPTSARNKDGLDELLYAIEQTAKDGSPARSGFRLTDKLPETVSRAVNQTESALKKIDPNIPSPEWIAFRLLANDQSVIDGLREGRTGVKPNEEEINGLLEIRNPCKDEIDNESIHQSCMESIYARINVISKRVIEYDGDSRLFRVDRAIDKVVTSKRWGFPIMILLLSAVFWLTIKGANYPSELLSTLLLDKLYPLLKHAAESAMPWWLSGVLIDGIYLATAWVVSVMLPPMAIFFPLFTLLEDFGYLPRVAFNLDKIFRKAGAHGKQALTMSMGFGCNAAGVVATRIINSPRERLIAIITNNFSLCNGRWPTQILIATIFIGAVVPAGVSDIVSIGAVIGIVLLGVGFTFGVSWLLSKTLLKGEASFFTLELPPYRPPKFWQTVHTSLIDRTLIILRRAVIFAIPAGAVIWLISNVSIEGQSIAIWIIDWLNPAGMFIGLNGVILLAYIIAIPANEIVIPTILMLTTLTLGVAAGGEGGSIVMFEGSMSEISTLLHAGGWTLLTAVNLMLFCLLHNPCSTTIYTIYKETRSGKWTLIATFLPVLIGVIVCLGVALIWRLF